MPYFKLDLPPGLYKESTAYAAGGRWYDGSLVRWHDRAVGPIGGWRTVEASGAWNLVPSDGFVSSNLTSASASPPVNYSLPGQATRLTDASSSTMGSYVYDSGVLSPTQSGRYWTLGWWAAKDGTTNYRMSLRVYTAVSTYADHNAIVTPGTGAVVSGLAVGKETWGDYLRTWFTVDLGSGNDLHRFIVTFAPAGTGAASTGSNTLYAPHLGPQGSPFALTGPGERVTGTTLRDARLYAPCMGAKVWQGDAVPYLALGTPHRAYAYSEGSLRDLTPDGFREGLREATSAQVYGAGPYGVGRYGQGAAAQSTVLEAQTWQFDNFGRYLIGVAYSDGKLYSWDLGSATRLAPVANAPTDNLGCIVTPQRFAVTLGAGGDARKVQWASQESLTQWDPLPEGSTAGDFPLQTAGEIQSALVSREEVLIWTDDDLHAMRYIGGTLVYAFEQVGRACGLLSRRAAVVTENGQAFWMSRGGFFTYDGATRTLKCDVLDAVQREINLTQASVVHAVLVAEYDTVRWYYRTQEALPDQTRYVEYNYSDDYWSLGSVTRTAGVDEGILPDPIYVGGDGTLYAHEVGEVYEDADGTVHTPFVESAPFEIGDGDRPFLVTSVVPDSRSLGDVDLRLFTRDYPTSREKEVTVSTLSNPTPVRARGRQARVRLSQRQSGWRLGTFRLNLRPAGGRR